MSVICSCLYNLVHSKENILDFVMTNCLIGSHSAVAMDSF